MNFTIYPRSNFSDFFHLTVCKTKKLMHTATGSDDSAGEFHPSEYWTRGNEIKTSNLIGHMFLCEECLTAPIIAHECLHAAMAHERLIERFNMSYGDEVNQHEERLAYYMTYCFDEVCLQLKKNGYKIKPTGC